MSSRSRQRKTPEPRVGIYENNVNTNNVNTVIDHIEGFINRMNKSPSKLVEITETYISIVGILQKHGDILYDLFGDFIDAIHLQEDSRKVLEQKGGVAISMGLNAARAAKNRKRRENRIRAYEKKKEEERIEKEINDQHIAKEKKINDARINEEHAKKIQENTTQIGPYGIPLHHDQQQSYDFAAILDHQQRQKTARDIEEQQRVWDLGAPQRAEEAQKRKQYLNDQVGQQLKYEAEVRSQVMCLIAFLAVILLFIDRKNVLSFIKSFFKSSSKKDEDDGDRSTPWIKVSLPATYTSSTRRGTRYSVETEDRSERYKYIRDPQRGGGKSKKMRTRNITQKKGY
jgi:hypothetical protein